LRTMIMRKVSAYQRNVERLNGLNLVADQAAEADSLAA
jgi:hypothetical protein